MLSLPFRLQALVMVFFNYSTMQMAAKVVYYGPGLCGKTTNLHHIYQHTANESRGEMVSLETETDRTLFFDLLPIDVGQIAGFNTRIQLYTVPGQVFYNTTRKLVLKGVDGVVFVADSQRAMMRANAESLKNLEENLGEMGLSLESLPIVLQYNKRDLADIFTVDELNQGINPKGWPHFESSALSGMGVFETLKGISKLTLLSLKKRLVRSSGDTAPPSASRRTAAPPPSVPAPVPPQPVPASPQPAPPAASPAPARPAAPAPPLVPAPVPARSRSVDILGELEKLRREATQARSTTQIASSPAAKASPNGRGELSRSIELTLKRADFARARRFLVSFQVEDDEHRVMDAVRDLQVEIKDAASLEKLLLRLNIALHSKD
jgi:signal recognition particle receptor subunit beta